jgi:transposase
MIMEEIQGRGAVSVVAEEARAERSEVRASSGLPDPEVLAVARRRSFTREYKMRILEEAERCRQPGEIGMLLRREGLHSSHLVSWRKLRREAARKAPEKRRGPKAAAVNPLAAEVIRLNRENARLQLRLRKAEGLLELQKKASELLGIELPPHDDPDEKD